MLLGGSECTGHAASAMGVILGDVAGAAVQRPRQWAPAHPPSGTQCPKQHLLLPQIWASNFPLALHVEENPRDLAGKAPSVAEDDPGMLGQGSKEPPVPPQPCQGDWALPGWQGWAHQQIPPGLGPLLPPFVGSGWAQGTKFIPNHNCHLCQQLRMCWK